MSDKPIEFDEHALQHTTKLSPREYGKLRGISPQLVYYHIREGKITKEACICGRSVIDIDLADKHFKRGVYSENNEREGEKHVRK